MRLFVAVWPSEDVVAALAGLDRPAVEGVRWTKREQWHVTLRFLGSTPEDEVAAVQSALAGVARGAGARDVAVGPVTACFGRGVLMVTTSGLDDLAAATVATTATFGEPPDDRPFAGHLTLARSGRGRRSRGPDLRQFSGLPLAASWTVDEITLVQSKTDRSGATYTVIGRWPLEGPTTNTRSKLR